VDNKTLLRKMLFFLLLMLFRSICHQVSNQADKLALLAIILLLADVSRTYSSGLPQGNVFLTTYNMQLTNNKKQ